MGLALFLALQAQMSAQEVVEWIEANSKHRFVYAAASGLANMKIRARKEDLDPSKAYEAGLALLKTVNLIAVRKEKAGVVEILHAAIGGKHEVPVLTSVEQIPAADEFCTLVIRVRFVSPRDVQAMLINLIGFPQNVLAMEDPPRVVLTDYASNLRRLATLAADFDRPRPEIAARIDADWLVKKFLDLRFEPLPADVAARVPKLLEALAGDSVQARQAGAKELAEIGPNAAPLVAPALESKDVELRGRVQELLAGWAEAWARR